MIADLKQKKRSGKATVLMVSHICLINNLSLPPNGDIWYCNSLSLHVDTDWPSIRIHTLVEEDWVTLLFVAVMFMSLHFSKDFFFPDSEI